MDPEPFAVGLRFAFLAILYMFLLVVAWSALRDLRRGTGAVIPSDGTGMHPARPGRVAATDASLVAVTGAGIDPGERIDLFGGVTIGRSAEADVRIEDRFASGVHCRVHTKGNVYFVEDFNSTNGTFLNGAQLSGEAPLHDLDEIRIGDTEFRFELAVPGGEG